MALPIDWESDVGGVLNVLLDSPVDADIDEADEDEEDADGDTGFGACAVSFLTTSFSFFGADMDNPLGTFGILAP